MASGREVENGQAAEAEGNPSRGVGPHACVIRATMAQGISHASGVLAQQQFRFVRGLQKTNEATHFCSLALTSFAQFIAVCSSAQPCEIGENLLSVSAPIS